MLSFPHPQFLQTGRPGRIVSVSSKLHFLGSLDRDDPLLTKSYNSLAAYSRSKLAQVGALALVRCYYGTSSGVGVWSTAIPSCSGCWLERHRFYRYCDPCASLVSALL